MGEGGPHSPDSEGGGAGGSAKGVKSEEGGESGESVRRRPPLKRQITRNQSDPKILPVKIFSRMKLNKIQSIMAPLTGFVRYFNLLRKLSKYWPYPTGGYLLQVQLWTKCFLPQFTFALKTMVYIFSNY